MDADKNLPADVQSITSSEGFSLLPLILVLVIGVGGISLLLAAKPKNEPAPIAEDTSPMRASVAEIRVERNGLMVKTQGSVTPRHAISLSAQVAGEVIKVAPNFDAGAYFEKGDVLLAIDDSDYRLGVLTAKSRLAEARRLLAEEQGRAQQARREWRDLGDSKANELFMRKPQLAAIEAQVKLAQGELANAQRDLRRTQIKAPFAGRIRSKHVDLGQMHAANAPIADIYSNKQMQVRLPLTQAQAALIDLPSEPTTNGAAVTLSAYIAGEYLTWQGSLNRIDAFIDDQSRLFFAWVDIVPDGQPALPGMFVDAEIEGRTIAALLALPREALVNQNAIVVLDEHNKAKWHTVEVMHKSDTQIWFTAGVNEGARALTSKQTLTEDGSEIDPIEHEATEVAL